MSRKLRKIVTLYLVIQVLYLTQIYPYAHFHAHSDSRGLHLDFVSHLVTEHGDPDADFLIPHQHAHTCQSDDLSTNETSDQRHESMIVIGEGCSTSLETCDFHENHHRYSSTFQLRSVRTNFAVTAHTILVTSEQYVDHENSILAFDQDERGPPDDILVTLHSPRPPPTVA